MRRAIPFFLVLVLWAGLCLLHATRPGGLLAGPVPCDVHVTRLPTSPPSCPLHKIPDGDAFELATGGLWVKVSISPPRAPYQGATTGGPPIPNAGSRTEGWPEVPPAPAEWVYCVEIRSGRLTLLPVTWQVWPVADWRATARTTH